MCFEKVFHHQSVSQFTFMIGRHCTFSIKCVFSQIQLDFLPPGHSHDDIDQVFSKFSKKLKRVDARTVSEMVEACKSSYSPTPRFQRLLTVINWYKIVCVTEPCLRSSTGSSSLPLLCERSMGFPFPVRSIILFGRGTWCYSIGARWLRLVWMTRRFVGNLCRVL